MTLTVYLAETSVVSINKLTCNLDNSIVDIVSDIWGSHVKPSLGSNVSRVSVDLQPPLGISAKLIPAAESRVTVTDTLNCPFFFTLFFVAASYLRSKCSGSKAIFRLSNVPGSTDSGTTICMGSSLKSGASFSFTTATVTVALLAGRLGALSLRRFTFCTVRTKTRSACVS